jgi:hypothetical protein
MENQLNLLIAYYEEEINQLQSFTKNRRLINRPPSIRL